jgi:hypothetical protein
MLFTICDEMKKVPNDPLIQEMEPRTMQWLYWNILEKRRIEKEAWEAKLGIRRI